MKFTLDDCLARINQVLNYPAVSYGDVSHFFDQAISELNTTFKIDIPSVSEMRAMHTHDAIDGVSTVVLSTLPTSADGPTHYSSVSKLPNPGSGGAYVCGSSFANRKFYKWDGDSWNAVELLYGLYIKNTELTTYVAVPIDTSTAVWAPVERSHVAEFNLIEYLPFDWWVLFVIPYVCFKFAVRNGDSGELFVNEFTQGHQQLQTSYNVPNRVVLSTVADRIAYTELVKQYLPNLANVTVPTRAVTSSMRADNSTVPTYVETYSIGGWEI